jgi:hypothetical protein
MGIALMAPKRAPTNEIDWPMTLGCGGTVAFVIAVVALAVWTSAKSRARHLAFAIEAQRQRDLATAEEQRRQHEHAAREADARNRWLEAEAAAGRQDAALRALAEQKAAQERWESLCQRFGQVDAARIQRREVWQGQTQQALLESCGRPADVDEQVMKTKTKHVFKYQPIGTNRYALRVTLENGVVVGWDDKR